MYNDYLELLNSSSTDEYEGTQVRGGGGLTLAGFLSETDWTDAEL